MIPVDIILLLNTFFFTTMGLKIYIIIWFVNGFLIIGWNNYGLHLNIK